MTTEEKRNVNKIIKDFGLKKNDVFIDNSSKLKIITRSGISKIYRELKKNNPGMRIKYRIPYVGVNSAVVLGTLFAKDYEEDTFGEANPNNNSFPFPVNVAEKRCRSRLILEYLGVYEEGFRGEDEMATKPINQIQGSSRKTIDDAIKSIKEKRRA